MWCGRTGNSTLYLCFNFTSVNLFILFTFLISLGHLPDNLMKSAIIPPIKNKTGDANDKNNCFSCNCFSHSYV